MRGRAHLHHAPGLASVVQQTGRGARGSGRVVPSVARGGGQARGCLPWDHLANSSGRMVGPHTSWDASCTASHSRLGRSVMLQGGTHTHTRTPHTAAAPLQQAAAGKH